MDLLKKEEDQTNELVDAAQAAIEQQISRGEYTSPWQEGLNETIDKILNREKFSYDMNADAFYQQAKDRYVQQGKQAMMDTIGQQSALTGGYGNSWAQTAGQQAYHGYLQGLNDNLVDFYGIARGAYDAETDDLYNQFNLYNNRDQEDYARYVDERDFNEQIRQFLAANPGLIGQYKQLLGENGTVNLEDLAASAVGNGGGNWLTGSTGKRVAGLNAVSPSGSTGIKNIVSTTGDGVASVENVLKGTDSHREQAQTILNAAVNGTITDAQAEKLFDEYGITEREVQRAAGIQNAAYAAPQLRPSQSVR